MLKPASFWRTIADALGIGSALSVFVYSRVAGRVAIREIARMKTQFYGVRRRRTEYMAAIYNANAHYAHAVISHAAIMLHQAKKVSISIALARDAGYPRCSSPALNGAA